MPDIHTVERKAIYMHAQSPRAKIIFQLTRVFIRTQRKYGACAFGQRRHFGAPFAFAYHLGVCALFFLSSTQASAVICANATHRCECAGCDEGAINKRPLYILVDINIYIHAMRRTLLDARFSRMRLEGARGTFKMKVRAFIAVW